MKLLDVQDLVRKDDDGKWDALVDPEELRFQNGRLRLPRYLPEIDGNVGPAGFQGAGSSAANAARHLWPTSWATGQLCAKLGIPVSYFRRCPLVLQDAQVNHWLHRASSDEENQPKQWLLRAKRDNLRGVLSERYARLGNSEVVESVLSYLEGAPYEVSWFAVTDESLHLRLVDPRLSREVLPGDRVIAGLHVSNSEVGMRAVTVDAIVWRLVCLNGLVRLVKGKSLLYRRHVGLSKAELATALPGAIREALIQGSGFMELMARATREAISDVEGAIALIASENNLSQTVQEQVKSNLAREPASQQETLYGLVNAFTFTAQALAPDDRYALEALAGRLLEAGPPPKVLTSRNGNGGSTEATTLQSNGSGHHNGSSGPLASPDSEMPRPPMLASVAARMASPLSARNGNNDNEDSHIGSSNTDIAPLYPSNSSSSDSVGSANLSLFGTGRG